MKDEIMKNPDVYVHKDERAPIFLKQLKESGKRTFLLTNSDWPYTNVGEISFLEYEKFLL